MRRLVFAAPFVVVVSCARSAKPTPAPDEDEADTDVATTTPPPRQWMPEPWPEHRPEERRCDEPARVVDELPPLRPEWTIEDFCRRARCNPPPPYPPSKPDPIAVTTTSVEAMQREGTGTRVRLDRRGGADRRWRAVFVDKAGVELPNGECTIVDWRYRELECTTALAPEQLATCRETLPVKLVPPQDLVERTERARAAWRDDARPDNRARVINVSVHGTDTILMVAMGRDHGVERTWQAELVDAQGKRVSACTIIRVDANRTTCKTTASPDRVRANPYVRLKP